jgi:hypothetical protein
MAETNANKELEYEKRHVHEVYEDIAGHFSSTRYKVRPRGRGVNQGRC